MSKPQTLLEKALKEPRRSVKAVDDDALDFAIALLNGDITLPQAVRATGFTDMGIVYRVYSCIRDAIASGIIPRIERTGAKNGKRE